ncbi:MAG TPA: VTT domain-containing protein [Dehalococcoidia bacterium]|nr:VTT domain-containing protein [Dehalococcoidia bacterium]
MATKPVRWHQLAIIAVSLIVISVGLAYLFQKLLIPVQPVLNRFAWLAYLGVFGIQLLSNLTIIAPVPVALAIMVSIATQWDPLLVALFASLGGALGELSGYFAGYIAKQAAINESTPGYTRIRGWMNRYGPWAIAFLAFQPVLPFDIGGIIAGAAKMSLWKFLPALWLGRFPKYLILSYFGVGVIHFFKW